MKALFFRLTCLAAVTLSAQLMADTTEALEDDRDIQALREWVNTSRQISLKELGGNLSISGEVRTEFQNSSEKRNGRQRRGSSAKRPASAQTYDVEVNLMLDFKTERTWAAIKIEFDEDAGIFNGTFNKIALERAYWGVRLIDADEYTFSIEIGRRSMSSIYDSKIEFGSLFDGMLLRYDHSFEKIGDFYFHPGVLLVNERRNQFAYVTEIGLLNIKNTGIYTKYSIIDWYTKHYKKREVQSRFRFLVQQLILGYRFKIQRWDKIAVLYSAALYNALAKQRKLSDHRRQAWAGYFGMSIGQLRKQWDWALDINYQIVQAQAIPDFDTSGIGMGNVDKAGFYTIDLKSITGGGANKERSKAAGNTNYRGIQVTFDLLLTDKLDMQQSYQQSVTLNRNIGPFRRYHQYELEFIYSW